LHVLRVTAVATRAIDHRPRQAHLRPARPAVLALAAALVVVVHHPLADPRFLLGDGRAERGDHAAGLVTGDHPGLGLDPAGDGPLRRGGAIVVQVAAAHARGLDLEDDVPRAWRGIGKLPQLQLAVPEEDDALHRGSSRA